MVGASARTVQPLMGFVTVGGRQGSKTAGNQQPAGGSNVGKCNSWPSDSLHAAITMRRRTTVTAWFTSASVTLSSNSSSSATASTKRSCHPGGSPFAPCCMSASCSRDKANGFGLVIAVDNRPLFGRVPALLEADTPAAGIPIGAPRKPAGESNGLDPARASGDFCPPCPSQMIPTPLIPPSPTACGTAISLRSRQLRSAFAKAELIVRLHSAAAVVQGAAAKHAVNDLGAHKSVHQRLPVEIHSGPRRMVVLRRDA
jgi:hypothetical protein